MFAFSFSHVFFQAFSILFLISQKSSSHNETASCVMSYCLLLFLATDLRRARPVKYKCAHEMLLHLAGRAYMSSGRTIFFLLLVSRQIILAPAFLSRGLDLLCWVILSPTSSLIISKTYKPKSTKQKTFTCYIKSN